METSTEKTFYQNPDVSVTQSRFVASGKTYAMRNISSVSLYKKTKSRLFEIALIFIGLALVVGGSAWIAGVIMIAFAVLLFFLRKNEYTVRINSNSGEADGYISNNRQEVQEIVNAVNEAIIFRG
jgi:hypothetical protein